MNILKHILLSLLTAALTLSAQAQLAFRHWDEQKGLPSDQIRAVTALDDGRVAFRTPNSLLIFDGTAFKTHYIDRSRQQPIRHRLKNVYTDYLDHEGSLWLKSPGYLAVYIPEKSSFIYNADSLLAARFRIEGHPDEIFIDKARDVWAVTSDSQLHFFNSRTRATSVVARTDGEWERRFGKILEISGDTLQVFAATESGGVRVFDKRKGRFVTTYEPPAGFSLVPDQKVMTVAAPTGRLWLMHGQHLWMREKNDTQWREFLKLDGGSNFFTSMRLHPDGTIWASASWSGLRIINSKTLAIEHYPRFPLEEGGAVTNDIQDIFIDSHGGAWLGLLWQGALFWHRDMHPFVSFSTFPDYSPRVNESVRSFLEMPDGTILVATSFNGIVRYNPTTGAKEPFRPDVFPSDQVYMCLHRDSKGAIWAGTYLKGFFRLMPDGRTERFNYDPSRPVNIGRAVFEDKAGRFWVSVNDRGVGSLDINSGNISMLADRHPRLEFHKRDYGIENYGSNEICVFGEEGIYIYNPLTDQAYVSRLDARPGKKYFSACNGFAADANGLLWFATDEGVIVRAPSAAEPEGFRDTVLREENSPLPSNYVSAIVEDRNGNIWATTASGIAKISATPLDNAQWKFEVSPYAYAGGWNAGRIQENSVYLTKSGELYLGGYNGAVHFNPETLSNPTSAHSHPVLLTGLDINNSAVSPGSLHDGRVILKSPLLNDESILLNHDENFITIHFSSLDLVSGPQRHYRYRMLNFDPDWVELPPDAAPYAVYTGMPPGKYIFQVQSSGINGDWSKTASMAISIAPPLWKTWWAYAIYVLTFVAALGTAVVAYNRRKSSKIEKEAEKREELERQKLSEMKFQFFTNISHEFRTPLALILTPLSHIIKTGEIPDAPKKKLEGVYRNAENLLSLVNRLLDFRKLEMGGEKLNVSRCRIVQFTDYLVDSFKNIADSKGITLVNKFDVPEDTDVYLDSHKLRHVLTNLYSNAMKFTPTGGTVTTTLKFEGEESSPMLRISVADTGCGISEKDLPRIFERFFQSGSHAENPSGSGIGLHLVREYVNLHHGEISVKSKEGQGSEFSFTIPLDLSNSQNEKDAGLNYEEETADPGQDQPSRQNKRPHILIAEDNAEFRDFLVEYLQPEFRATATADGEEALEAARKSMPDIIVTDLMMPRMNGLKLIEAIKGDISTSHIPVILLTAKATDESRIESYKVGADSYISKPFNYDVLQARLHMLLEQARQRKSDFRKDIEITPSAVTITPIDEKMVQQALATVEENIDNYNFSAAQLGEALGLSRSQLYRKFEAVTGMSPADFILNIRLKRAAQLLLETRLNVSEISDMTGFNSTKYFNKHFKEKYQMTPTAFRSKKEQPI